MWFKQLRFYLLDKSQLPTAEELSAALAEDAFSPCMGLDWDSIGFVPPVPFSTDMVFVAQKTWRIALKTEEKVLPSAVIRDVLDEKVAEIQQNEGRNVGRKERQELKNNIIDDLLPRAFTKSSRIEAIIDTEHGFLFVDQASANKAELLLTKLRFARSGLIATLPRTQCPPRSMMTDWMRNGKPADEFCFGYDCELQGLGEVISIVRIKEQDLTAIELINLIDGGKSVTQLELCWQDRVGFILTSDFTFKRIQFLDGIQEKAAEQGEDMESLMFASQVLMTDTLAGTVNALAKSMGGFIEE